MSYPIGYPIKPPNFFYDASQLGFGTCADCKFSDYDKDWKPNPESSFSMNCVSKWYHIETRCMHHKVVLENLPSPPVGCIPGIPVNTKSWCDYYLSDSDGKVEELDYRKIHDEWKKNNKK